MNKEIRNHKDLEVWKKSVDLVSNIYKITESFPNKEIYGLTNQIRRSAVLYLQILLREPPEVLKKNLFSFCILL